MTLRSCLVLAVSLFAALVGAQVAVQNRWADVVISKRDYAGNILASDRNAYYANNGTGGTLPAIEYNVDQGGAGQVSGVVFVRGTSSTTIQVTFKNTNTFALSGTVRFISAKLTEPDANGNEDAASTALTVSPTSVQNISLPANDGSQTFSITVSGLPNFVALGHLALNYDLPLHDSENTLGNNGTNGNYEQWEKLFVVDSAPVGLQTVPWTDLLEASCRWAFGAVGQDDMRQKMVMGMRHNSRSPHHTISYNLNQDPIYVKNASQANPNRPLRLRKFVVDLDAWDTSQPTSFPMQCADYAAILNTAFASQ